MFLHSTCIGPFHEKLVLIWTSVSAMIVAGDGMYNSRVGCRKFSRR